MAPPGSVFWALTGDCAGSCLHCRNAVEAGSDRALDLHQALDIARQIAALDVGLVVLTGGEPTRYPGWQEIARTLVAGGQSVRLFLSGLEFDRAILADALAAGINQVAVSLDGPSAIHNQLRPHRLGPAVDAFEQATAAIALAVDAGLSTRVVTQANRLNIGCLDEIYDLIVELGAGHWQVQLCQMTGRAKAEREALMPDPADLERIVNVLLRAGREKRLVAPLHCTVGYLTAEEAALRGRGASGRAVWRGCVAGIGSLAITSAGEAKGCAALPDEFITESVINRPLEQIWGDDAYFPYSRGWESAVLGGGCSRCDLSAICRAGCPAVAYGATGSVGTNPYCLRLLRGGVPGAARKV